MANKARIARLMARQGNLPLRINRSIAYHPGFGTIVSGLLVEGTPYKDTVYLHHYVQPFFAPQDRITLTYSRRLPRNTGSDTFEGTDEQIAALCLQTLDQTGLRDHLAISMAESTFIALVTQGQIPNRDWRTELDLGAAHAILGNLTAAAEHLARARQEFDDRLPHRRPFASDSTFRATLDAFEAMLKQPTAVLGQRRLADTIKHQAQRNAAIMSFQKQTQTTSVTLYTSV